MSKSVEELLNHVRILLDELKVEVVKLYRDHKDVFQDSVLEKLLIEFRDEHKKATERLANPTLSIAMLGTTSAGKSTIVNALIGRRIAPIEAGEMSGGVLTLRASDELQLIINGQEPITDLNDDQVYDQIQQLMLSYHKDRKTQEKCYAPSVTVYGPLLPSSDRRLLNLPEGIGFEFLDLPGLNSMQEDDSNLSIIREQIDQACNLVALDYSQTDEERRKKLLKELKEVVGYLKGRTDSMIFILNRVDKRGFDDLPVEYRVKQLKNEIREVLELKEVPDIIPFSARLLYYAQCAWGAGSMKESSQVTPETRIKFLNAMFEDCATIIKRNTKNNPELANSFSTIEKKVNSQGSISDKTMRRILQHAHQWSGGKELWQTLNYRVEQSFPELVIFPALNPVFKTFHSLMASLDTVAKVRKLKSREEVEERRRKLREDCKKLNKKIKSDPEDVKTLFKSIIRKIQSDDATERQALIVEAENNGIQGLSGIRDIVGELQKLLSIALIRPVSDALENCNQYNSELRDNLQDVILFRLADGIYNAYAQITFGFMKLESDGKGDNGELIFKASIHDKEKCNSLSAIEQGYQKMNIFMAEALVLLAEFKLQTEAKKFGDFMQDFVKNRSTSLLTDVANVFINLNFPEGTEAIEAEFNRAILASPPQLPERFFKTMAEIESDIIQETEKVGSQNVEYTETKRFLFLFKRDVTKYRSEPIYEDIEYQMLKVPDINTLSEQWGESITNAGLELWEKLYHWIIEYLDSLTKEFGQAIDVIEELVEDSLQEQLTIIQNNFDETQKLWNTIGLQKDVTIKAYQALEKSLKVSTLNSEN
jgi:GTPase SAR1 family protein